MFRLLCAAEHPGEGLDRRLAGKLLGEMQELAPGILENLPVINR